MKKFIVAVFLIYPFGITSAFRTMERLRLMASDDLGKAEYYLDTYPNLSPGQQDQVWLWLRNGCRSTLAYYSAIEAKHGAPSPENAIDIISDQIGPKIRWARIFNKAVARGIRPVLESGLYDQYEQHRAYQDHTREQTQPHNDAVDPE
jgi:hypothetical protein